MQKLLQIHLCILYCAHPFVSAVYAEEIQHTLQLYDQKCTESYSHDAEQERGIYTAPWGSQFHYEKTTPDALQVRSSTGTKTTVTEVDCTGLIKRAQYGFNGIYLERHTETPDDIHVQQIMGLTHDKRPLFYKASTTRGRAENHIAYSYDSKSRLQKITRGQVPGAKTLQTYTYTYDNHDRVTSKMETDGTKIHYQYDDAHRTTRLYASDNSLDYHYHRDAEGNVLSVTDAHHTPLFTRTLEGPTRTETLMNGHTITTIVDDKQRPLIVDLGEWGQIRYTYEGENLTKIARYDENNVWQYEHTFDGHDDMGRAITETLISDLGITSRTLDLHNRTLTETSPYHTDMFRFDDNANVLQHNKKHYKYDHLGQMEGYDGLQNPTNSLTNSLNQVTRQAFVNYHYDKRGNLSCKHSRDDKTTYRYDALNRLREVHHGKTSVHFQYDPFGRRMTKEVYESNTLVDKETYLYQDLVEIGSVDADGLLRSLRVIHPRTERAIAFELEGETFAPVYDLQDNVKHLIRPDTRSVACTFVVSPFGDNMMQKGNKSITLPWTYMNKRKDVETGLYYFEQRYYDPQLKRWISPDSYTERTEINQYAFLNNNPFLYRDSNGRVITIAGWVVIGVATVVVAAIVYDNVKTGFEYRADAKRHYRAGNIEKGDECKRLANEEFKNAFGWLMDLLDIVEKCEARSTCIIRLHWAPEAAFLMGS